MSNSHIFLKSGFPRAPLQNGLGRYICQLQRITLKFCKNNGSSKGIREFLENDIINFSKKYPGIVVYVKPRRHRTPVMVAEYLNGNREWINCRNYSREEVSKWLSLLRTQNGSSSSPRLRKMYHTNIPSIQGPWSPFTFKNPQSNLIVFPDEELSLPRDVENSATQTLFEIMKREQLNNIAKNVDQVKN